VIKASEVNQESMDYLESPELLGLLAHRASAARRARKEATVSLVRMAHLEKWERLDHLGLVEKTAAMGFPVAMVWLGFKARKVVTAWMGKTEKTEKTVLASTT
jgi:hypothetical protein